MDNKIVKVSIFAIFLLAAMSHVALAWSPSYNTETECRSCHGTDVSDRHHLLVVNGTYKCLDCHAMKNGNVEIIRNCLTCHAGKQHTCMSCHLVVNSLDLGSHSALNNSSAVDNGDCTTCHHDPFPMVKGAVNNSNTYFCADCHTSGGTGPNRSSKIFLEKRHGKASCMDCHVADGKYHQDNPRGSVANSTYVNRYVPGNTTVTDCADCHYATNLDDAPFNAPGGGQHIINNGGACATGGGCHTVPPGNNMIQTIHRVGAQNQSLKPSISIPSLNASTVLRGTDVSVTATVNFTGIYAFIDGAQYRIMSGLTEIRSWTPMSAADGNFNSIGEVAIATINTNSLTLGTYSIEVRGMAGGPAQNISLRYYPMNGDNSTSKAATLTIEASLEYINGTIKSGGLALPGAYVSTDGANDTTKSDGSYSLRVINGTHSVTVSKQPTHYDNTVVTQSNTTNVNISLVQKPTGTISGIITSV